MAILTDAEVRALNKRYRRVDKVTDVLSFPAGGKSLSPEPLALSPSLGDIVIARGVARRQAVEMGHPVATELRILALHGLLHLLGCDHEVDAGRMARMESRLRRRAGLPLGLIARSS